MTTSTILPSHLQVKPHESVEKLNALQFDPIQRLVKLHDKIELELNDMLYDEDGEPRRKFSQVAFAALIAVQAKISNDLIRYGYARVLEVQEVKQTTPDPIRIVLS